MPGYASAWQVKSAFWEMLTVTFSGGETMYGGPRGNTENLWKLHLQTWLQKSWLSLTTVCLLCYNFSNLAAKHLKHKGIKKN